MNPQDENFYISPELSEVVDLMLKRQRIKSTLIASPDKTLEEELYLITNKIEKLLENFINSKVIKEPKNEKIMENPKQNLK